MELHGSSLRNYCLTCGSQYPPDTILSGIPMPKCSCGGLIRPDVVLYYEEAFNEKAVSGAIREIRKCDLMIIGGTSLAVYQAAAYAAMCWGKLVIINQERTPIDTRADIVIRESIGRVFSGVMAYTDLA